MPPIRLSRRNPVAHVVVLVSLAIFLAPPIHATESPVALAPSDIRAALQGAWRQHPSFRATEAQLAAANARRDAAAKPLYNPAIELSVNDEGPDRTATAGINLTLDLSGKRRVRGEAAEARVDQATAEARLIRREFTRQWFAGWADLLIAMQCVGIGERRLALVARFADLAEKRFAADDVSGLDRDLATLARDEAQVQQSLLETERADAQARFRAVGGAIDQTSNWELPTNALPEPSAQETGNREEQPDWQVARSAAIARSREVVVARRNRVADPTLAVSGGRIDYGSFRDNVIGVSLSVPLFMRNSHAAEVIAAQADADAAEAEVEKVGLQLDVERERAISNYESSRSAWIRWQASRGTDVERRASLLERLWEQGELSTADYLLQLRQTLDTALAGAELEARVWRSFVEYLAATGQLERWSGLEGSP